MGADRSWTTGGPRAGVEGQGVGTPGAGSSAPPADSQDPSGRGSFILDQKIKERNAALFYFSLPT